MKTSELTRAEILIEWWDERQGAEVYAEVVRTLELLKCEDITSPQQGWLDYTPTVNGKHTGEGELWFHFTHRLAENEFARRMGVDFLREIARLKFLDWDCDAPKEWDYED
jgi:hypothetical protein